MFGGVFEKGSLAKERNGFTFLSNLVRTSLACSTLRIPRLQSVRRSPVRGMPSPQGWAVSWQTHAGAEVPAEGNQASLLSSLCSQGTWRCPSVVCPSSQSLGRPARTPHPSLPPAPARESDESWGQPVDTPRFTHHSPSVTAPSASSPSSSFQESLLHSLTRTHTPQILHHKLVQKRVFAILKVWSRETSLLAAARISPSLLTPSLASGRAESPG